LAQPNPPDVSRDDLNQIVDRMNEALTLIRTDLQFQIESGGTGLVVNVVDRDTGEIIRQIPSTQAQRVEAALDELKGTLIEDVA